jgi:predicted acyltransferase
MSTTTNTVDINKRLYSLDFMRGFIMMLLTLESTGIFKVLFLASKENFLAHIFIQFQHHPWHGLRFWDLIQPGFMFIAGIAMTYSIQNQQQKNISKKEITIKTIKRSGWLFFWGVLCYAVKDTGLSFELWNVLTQLSFTMLVAYLIFEWQIKSQMCVGVAILTLTDLLYRYSNIPGYNLGFTNHFNFGNYIDMILMNKTSRGGWVAINCIPTSVHTIAGVIIGKLLLNVQIHQDKIKKMVLWGLGTLLLGYTLDLLQINPIIKRIATSSFTLVSLGWCILFYASTYYIIDIKQYKKIQFLRILSLNSIFIYLFFETVGSGWLNNYVKTFAMGVLNNFTQSETFIALVGCTLIFLIEWGICYFLYKKKIFFKL